MTNIKKYIPNSVEGWLFLVIALFVLIFSSASEYFLTMQNLLDLLDSYAVNGIFALGLFVVLVTGGIDISFAAVASVVQYIIAHLLLQGIIESPMVAIGLASAIGLSLGILNALLIYYLKAVSIIITISMQAILFGLLMWITRGQSIYSLPDWWIDSPEWLLFIVNDTYYQIGVSVLIMLIMAVITWIIVNKTKIGRQLYAVGGSEESAVRVGIRVNLVMMFAYGYLGFSAAIASLMQAHRMSEVVPNSLVGGELDVLAAVVLGGASLSGGKGSVLGTIMGVFLIGILQNGLNLVGVSSYFVNIVIGAIIILAICITHYNKRKETDVGFA